MSEANLNIWITRKGHPCEIDNNPVKPDKPGGPVQLYVYVLHCNGEVLEWCGQKYVGLQAKCGHLALTVPPGCYIVGAVEDPKVAYLAGHWLGNHLTHLAIVRVNCGDHACVTLFNPTFPHCGHWFLKATRNHLMQEVGLPDNLASAMRRAETAVKALLAKIPQDSFTANQIKALDTAASPGSED